MAAASPSRAAKFVDSARIHVRAGHGGAGSTSFRRQPFEPRGGPDGGDGGRGGSILAMASTSVSSLAEYARRQQWRAQDGAAGAGARKEGRQGGDVQLQVPVGTQVLDDESGALLADLDRAGASAVIARGGLGGRGNVHFASSVQRTPRFSEPGTPGEERWLRLELKLIAEAGLVGLPNAGKSSLLRAMSAATPRVGDYPFTTLDPELGVATSESGRRLTVADIPGLIEGAAQGAGLGLRFLRHVERTRVLVYVVDGSAAEPWDALRVVRGEVAAYSPSLVTRPSLVAVNKLDLEEVRRLRGRTRRREVYFVSALTGEGIADLVEAMASAAAAAPALVGSTRPVRIRLAPEVRGGQQPVAVERRAWGFEVSGDRAKRLVSRTDFDSEVAVERFQLQLDRLGVTRALEEAGAEPGDTVRIGELEFEYQP